MLSRRRPDPPPEAHGVGQPLVNPPAQQPSGQAARQREVPPVAQPQSPPAGTDDMYVNDKVDPDVLREMTIQMDEAIDMQENQRASTHALPPAKSASTSKGKHAASSTLKTTLGLITTLASSSLKNPSTASSVKTSSYFTAHTSDSKPIPDIGLSPRPGPLSNMEPDFDITWDIDDTESSKSARPESSVKTKQVLPSDKRPSSPNPYDELSFDMDVDESFFEQVGMIEQGALSTGANNKGKGKGKDIVAEGSTSHSRPSAAGRKTPSGSALGTKTLALRPVSPSGAESSTRMQSNTRATSTSSLSGSAETPMPRSTQSSDRRLPRDPSLIILSSSEDETPRGSHSANRPSDLVRKHGRKRKGLDWDNVADSDVIDISD